MSTSARSAFPLNSWTIADDAAERLALTPVLGQRVRQTDTPYIYEWDGSAWFIAETVSAVPAPTSLTIVTTQAELDAALASFKDGYTGLHEIEVRFTPVRINQAKLPASDSGSGGSLTIVADRSAPLVSSPAATFALDALTSAQYEDPAFGAHAGIAAGTHWAEADVSGVGVGFSTTAVTVLTSVSPAVRIVSETGVTGPVDIYPYTNTLELNVNNGAGPLLGDGARNHFGGTRLMGFIIDGGVSGEMTMVEGTAVGCRFANTCRFSGCVLGGVVEATATVRMSGYGGTASGSGMSRTESLHVLSGGFVAIAGYFRLGPLVTESRIDLSAGCNITSFRDADFALGAATPCIRYGTNTSINLPSSTSVTISGSATTFVEPTDSTTSSIHMNVDPSAVIRGTVSAEGVNLVNGSYATNLDAAAATLVTGTDDILLDGASFTFADSATGAFSLTTGSFIRS